MKRDVFYVALALVLAVVVVVEIVRAVTAETQLDELVALTWAVLAAIGLVLVDRQ